MSSGTTLIEARRLGRNSVGVDIQKSVVAEAFDRINTEPNDISNTTTLDAFLSAFGEVIDNATAVLDKGRYLACVIGDKSAGGEIIPLGFYCMQLFLQRGFKLKATIVKNFDETKGKSGQQGI
jgi:DNA modification methylase